MRLRFTVLQRAFVLTAIVAASIFPSVANAQVSGGTIQGTVVDKQGAVVAGAEVTVTNQATNVTTTVSTNANGLYSAANILPGEYTLSVKAPRFATSVQRDIELTVGQQQQINVQLVPGTVAETVVVTTQAPAVELATSELGKEVDGKTVRELPLNGRSWTQLATLEVGVSAVHTQVILSNGPDRGNRGFGDQISISGGRPAQNNYRLDGVSINDYSNGAPGSVLGENLGVDAVQEFSVLTSNYSAEYGRTSGGVVNAITRSGTNSFHGSAYEFFRNSALDTKTFFEQGPKQPFNRNQFGASLGGPIIKDRTFIFGDYEGDKQSTSITTPINVPSADARAGNLQNCPNPSSDPNAPPTIPCTFTVDQAVAQFLKSFYPLPNGTVSGDTGIFSTVIQAAVTENYFTIHGDHKFTDRDSITGTYVYDKANTSQPDPLNVILTGNRTDRYIIAGQETHLFNDHFSNAARFGLNHILAFAGQNIRPINSSATNTALGSVPGRPAPGIVFGDSSIATFPGGLGASPNYRFNYNSYQFYDDAFFVKGLNSFKFGVAVELLHNNILASSDANGIVTYATLFDFLNNGAVQNFNAALPGFITERQLRQSILGFYLQDDVKLRPNLTLNAGLRYEMSTVPSETHGRISNLLNPADAAPHLGSPFFNNPTLKNFEPRIGFSYDPFGNGKTAIRGGFGMFDVLPLPYLFELLVPLAAPFYQLGTNNNLPGGNFPGGLFQFIQQPNNLRQSYVQHNPKRNYTMQWNINVQREIANGITAMVAFVGNRGVHQAFRADDINTTLPADPASLTPTYPVGGAMLNPNVGQISSVIWQGDSYYKAIEAKLTLRAFHGFDGQVSYTGSNAVDTGSATVGGDSFSNSISSLPYYNERIRKGPADFNVAHNLVISSLYEFRKPSFSSGMLNGLLSGWRVTGIFQASTGIPFTPNIGGDPLGLNSTDPFDFPDRLRTTGCGSLVNPGNVLHYIKTNCLAFPADPVGSANLVPNRRGNLTRNALTGPGLKNLDFSLIKDTPIRRISDAFTVQFRAEVFNLANHPNFAPPVDNQTVFDQTGAAISTAGAIDALTTPSRQIQFGVKIIF